MLERKKMKAVKGHLHLKINDYYANFNHLYTGVRNIIKFIGI